MTRRAQAVLTACLGIGIAILPHAVHAQAVYGSVNGTVTDASGAAIPGATVTVTDEAKGTSVTVKSNESGNYTVEHMIPDPYTVKVEATGFKGFETNHLQVLADTSPKVDATHADRRRERDGQCQCRCHSAAEDRPRGRGHGI